MIRVEELAAVGTVDLMAQSEKVLADLKVIGDRVKAIEEKAESFTEYQQLFYMRVSEDQQAGYNVLALQMATAMGTGAKKKSGEAEHQHIRP